MQSGESIYNLIPPPEVQQARPPMHKSQHPGTVDPAKFGLGPRRARTSPWRAGGRQARDEQVSEEEQGRAQRHG